MIKQRKETTLKYDNYIFDLYGTLVDIHTDEHTIVLWRKMAKYVKQEFGVVYKPSALRKRYKEIYKDEVIKLAKKLNVDHPEIRISWVWDRLLAEGAAQTAGSVRRRKGNDSEEPAIKIPTPLPNDGPIDAPSPEIARLCTFFRETSRDMMQLYPGTEEMLKKLHDNGKKVYLLSNAQRSFTYKEIVELGLDKHLDDIFISTDKMIMKPQKQFLQMLMEKHNLVREKCVMIGNEIGSDGEVARLNNVDSIIIKDGDFSKIFEI